MWGSWLLTLTAGSCAFPRDFISSLFPLHSCPSGWECSSFCPSGDTHVGCLPSWKTLPWPSRCWWAQSTAQVQECLPWLGCPLAQSSLFLSQNSSISLAALLAPPSPNTGPPSGNCCICRCPLQVPQLLSTLAGSRAGPLSPPLVLVSAFLSVALPALPHDLCVYVFVEAAGWGLPCPLSRGRRTEGCGVTMSCL